MNINWYPGHMTKAVRMIEDSLKLVDIVIFVLDARAPKSSLNPAAERLAGGKPCLYVLNKADLSDSAALNGWLRHYSAQKKAVVAMSAAQNKSGKIITEQLNRLAQGKLRKYAEKGVTATVRAMVLGVPNSGKSTLINNLAGEARALTGNKPGVTRGKQWLKISENIELLDTPGVLPPNLEDPSAAKNLAYIGSVKDDVVDLYELALSLIENLQRLYPDNLTARYAVDATEEPAALLEKICAARGALGKGGGPDTGRGAKLVLDDFRKGRLGKICLDSLT